MLSEIPVQTPDGQPFRLLTLRNDAGMVVMLMDWGVTLFSARIPLSDGGVHGILPGCANPKQYPEQAAFLDASAGRYANHIVNSRYTYAGKIVELVLSQGDNQLRGGPDGFDKYHWQIVNQNDRQVPFALTSDDGDQGFSGHLCTIMQCRLTDDNRISMTYRATVDKPCPVNLTNHAYFNLDGDKTDAYQHKLQVMVDEYLPVDETDTLHGGPKSVADNTFDFRSAKIISSEFLADDDQRKVKGYDRAFLLQAQDDTRTLVVRLWFQDEKLQIVVYTSAPALQSYSGNFLGSTPSRGSDTYKNWQGLVLESEFLPDSPDHPEWQRSNYFLRPGEEYVSVTEYQFLPV